MKKRSIQSLRLIKQGKVRKIYELDLMNWLIVASNNISAFDIVLPDQIPGKGEVLTKMSYHWFKMMEAIAPNHLSDDYQLSDLLIETELYANSMLVRKMTPLPIEAIVRGHLAGSAYSQYQNTGCVYEHKLPKGLQKGEKLQSPIFTPSTKAEVGEHDENISYAQMVDLIGQELSEIVREISLAIYQKAYDYAEKKGVILIDTKFEFGLDSMGNVYIIDELLTPDSSRFCFKDEYEKGVLESFDKQFIRDHLVNEKVWNKKLPAPHLSSAIIDEAIRRYRKIFTTLFAQ